MRETTFSIGIWTIFLCLALAPSSGTDLPPEPPPAPVAETQMFFFTEEAWQMRKFVRNGPFSLYPSELGWTPRSQ